MSKYTPVIQNRRLQVSKSKTQMLVYVDEALQGTWGLSTNFGKETVDDFKEFFEFITPYLETMSDYERALKYAPILWHLQGKKED